MRNLMLGAIFAVTLVLGGCTREEPSSKQIATPQNLQQDKIGSDGGGGGGGGAGGGM